MKLFNKEEYNRMCAELLGLHRSDEVAIYKMTAYPYDFLRFDTDWNWIMEVVEKINSINVFENPSDTTLLTIRAEMRVYLGLSNKEAVVQAIWEFLQWYNNQKPKN